VVDELSRSTRRFLEIVNGMGIDLEVVELPASTRTAVDAASAIGCSVAHIVKSLLFRTVAGKEPLMVLASGVNRVNESRIAELVGEPIEKADAAYVREKTGFVIGGVPPVGHPVTIRTFIDEDLLKLDEIWAAAGTPNSVCKLSADVLVKITNGEVKAIK